MLFQNICCILPLYAFHWLFIYCKINQFWSNLSQNCIFFVGSVKLRNIFTLDFKVCVSALLQSLQDVKSLECQSNRRGIFKSAPKSIFKFRTFFPSWYFHNFTVGLDMCSLSIGLNLCILSVGLGPCFLAVVLDPCIQPLDWTRVF